MAISSKEFTESQPDVVPLEFKESLTQMTELDQKNEYLLNGIRKKIEDYRSSLKIRKRNEIYDEIMSAFKSAQDTVDDKMKLTCQTYDLIDKHLRILKSGLKHRGEGLGVKQTIACSNSFTKSTQSESTPGINSLAVLDNCTDNKQSTSYTAPNQTSASSDDSQLMDYPTNEIKTASTNKLSLTDHVTTDQNLNNNNNNNYSNKKFKV